VKSIYSAGARYERDALRDYLRRKMKRYGGLFGFSETLSWVLDRKKRYDKKPKGLGK